MKKSLPQRYLTTDSVKKALNINSFRNLSKDKVMKFISMIPYMNKDVAIAIINQFPEYTKFADTAINVYSNACDSILKSNQSGHEAAVKGYQTILDALKVRLESPSITEEERKNITIDMIEVADRIEEANIENKKFLGKVLWGFGIVLLGSIGAVAAVFGANSSLEGTGDIPQLSDDEDEDE